METLSKKNLVRWLNEHDVLQLIFNSGPISRSQVAQQLPLNKVTVSGIFNDLIERGLVLEIGEGASGENDGRKPTMSQFNAHYGYVVSFDLGADYLDQLVAYPDSSIISFKHFSAKTTNIQNRLHFTANCLNQINIPFAEHQLLGIAIAIHGTVYNNQVLYSSFIDLDRADILNFFTSRYSVPVLLENEANLAAVYERDFNGPPVNGQNLVTLSQQRDPAACTVLNRFTFYMANVIHNAIVAYAPDRVILNSMLIAELPELLLGIMRNMRSLTVEPTVLLVTKDVRTAILLGGVSLITHHVLELDNCQLMFHAH